MSKVYRELKEETDTLDFAAQQSINELSTFDFEPEDHLISEEQRQELQEAGVSAVLIISIIMALPSLIQKLVKAFGWVWKRIKKLFTGQEEESEAVERVVEFTEKWHHAYIKVLQKLLKYSGVFKSAGITDKEAREKATKVVFYTIVFGLAVYGGIASAGAIKKVIAQSKTEYLDMAILESVLTSVKAKEVQQFVSELMG